MDKFYITTSIAYVNAAPHIGFALESVQADVLARYNRQLGKPVFFLTGTDEHGAKIARAAEVANEKPQQFVDRISAEFKKLKSLLNLSWDDFIRTTDEKRHWPNVEKLWRQWQANGDLYKKNYRGLYCVGHEAFVTEKDLKDGKCQDHQKEPEVIEEENYFFRLSKYAPQVRNLIAKDELLILPEGKKKEVLAFLDQQEIEDISFSRPRKDLNWGIPVPDDDSQTIYVWADALTNYLMPKDWWPADVHLIGKDILRFHAIYWPAMLLAAKLPLPKKIFVHGHITVDGQKMSKSLGNVVDPFSLVEKYGSTSSPQVAADIIRYFLLRELPSGDDGDFSYEKLAERYQGELANGLGNFTARVLALGEQVGPIAAEIEPAIDEAIFKAEKAVAEKIENFRLHEALAAIWELISFGDAYVNENKVWAIVDAEEKKNKISQLAFILERVCFLVEPFLPATVEAIGQGLTKNEKGEWLLKKIPVLFPRLDK
ncbi:MAG: methionine--tRNA ligase [bacterium]|nr:methionine--tRNA ligase [bacterium]